MVDREHSEVMTRYRGIAMVGAIWGRSVRFEVGFMACAKTDDG